MWKIHVMYIDPTLTRHIDRVPKMCLNDVISGILFAIISVPFLTTCCLAKKTSQQEDFSNVAMDKPTLQISTLDEHTPEKSVDGKTGTNIDHGDCAMTLPEQSPWWLVHLQDYYQINHLVVVTNLSPKTDNNILSFKIEVAMDTGPDAHLLQPYVCTENNDIVLKEVATYNCRETLVGRVVKLTALSRAAFFSLVLCEVQVFGRALFQETEQGTSGDQGNKVYNQSNHDLKELRKMNKIDKKKSKSARRRKVSAKDPRASSAVVGTVAIVIMSFTFGSIILSDCRTFYLCVRKVHRKAKKAKRTKNKNNMTAAENILTLENQPSGLSSELIDTKCTNKKTKMELDVETNACQAEADPDIKQSIFTQEEIRKKTDTKKIPRIRPLSFRTGKTTKYLKNSKTKARLVIIPNSKIARAMRDNKTPQVIHTTDHTHWLLLKK